MLRRSRKASRTGVALDVTVLLRLDDDDVGCVLMGVVVGSARGVVADMAVGVVGLAFAVETCFWSG